MKPLRSKKEKKRKRESETSPRSVYIKIEREMEGRMVFRVCEKKTYISR